MHQQMEFGAVDSTYFSGLQFLSCCESGEKKKKYLNFSKPLVFSAFLYVVYFFVPTNNAQAVAFI